MSNSQLNFLLDAIGLEEPLGVFYSATAPGGAGPKGGKGHDCLMKYVRMAQTKKQKGWISRQAPACRGGAIYAGFAEPNDAVAVFVSSGNDKIPGEKYLPDSQCMWKFFTAIDTQKAPADYCVFKPLSQFKANEEPLAVVFFVRGEQLAGLCQLAFYAFASHEAVAFPFGSGCASILSWPLLHARKGINKAIVGGSDPSCRPYLATDELSFAVPAKSFELMLEKAPESFLSGQTWQKARKKIAQSKKRWARTTRAI